MKDHILVMGASENVQRYANMAVRKLINHNIKVKAFGNKVGQINGVDIIKELKLYDDIDTITLYLNPTNQKLFYDYIISLKPRRVIFNPGTENKELQQLLTQHNIMYEEACTLVLLSTNQY